MRTIAALLKTRSPFYQPRQLRYLCAMVSSTVSLLWRVRVYDSQCRVLPLGAWVSETSVLVTAKRRVRTSLVSSSPHQNECSPSKSALPGKFTWPTIPFSQCHQRECQESVLEKKKHRDKALVKTSRLLLFASLNKSHFLSLLCQNALNVLTEQEVSAACFQKTSSPQLPLW